MWSDFGPTRLGLIRLLLKNDPLASQKNRPGSSSEATKSFEFEMAALVHRPHSSGKTEPVSSTRSNSNLGENTAPQIWFWGILLFLISFGLRWKMLTQTNVATGTDGYYFAEQCRFLAEHGRFRSFENSIVVVFCAAIERLVGNPILSVKGGVSLLSGLTASTGFLYGLNSIGRLKTGILLGSLLAVSPSLSYLSVHFPKTAGAPVFLFAALAVLEWGLSLEKPNTMVLALSGILFLALGFAHKLIFLIGGWIAIGTLMDYGRGHFSFRPRTFFLSLLLIVSLLTLGKVFLPTDLLRIFPALAWPQGWPLTLLGKRVFLHPSLHAEIVLTLLALIPGGIILKNRPAFRYRTFAWLVLIPALFNPLLNYTVLDLGYRLVLTVFLPGAVLWSWWIPTQNKYVLGGLGLCALFGFWTSKVYEPRFDETNATTYQHVIDQMPKTEFPLVICHLGLNYFYTWATGKDSLAFLPDDRQYPPEHTWRISWGVSYDAYENVLGQINRKDLPPVQMLTPHYALIREDVWRLFLAGLQPGTFLDDVVTSWRNPYKKRPSFISTRTLITNK